MVAAGEEEDSCGEQKPIDWEEGDKDAGEEDEGTEDDIAVVVADYNEGDEVPDVVGQERQQTAWFPKWRVRAKRSYILFDVLWCVLGGGCTVPHWKGGTTAQSSGDGGGCSAVEASRPGQKEKEGGVRRSVACWSSVCMSWQTRFVWLRWAEMGAL